MLNFLSLSSSSKLMICITSLNAVDSAIYSAFVVDNAVNVCIVLFYTIGHPANIMIKPVLDLTDFGSCDNS